MNAAWTRFGAVEDGPAAPNAVAVTKDLEALVRAAVAAVEDETMGVDDGGWPHPARICPHGGTRSRAGAAEDAFRRVVIARAFFRRLQALGARLRLVIDEIGLDLLVLGEEGVHIYDQVANHRETQHRLDGNVRANIFHEQLAGEPVASVDAHRIGAADAVRAGASKCQGAVLFPFDLVQNVQEPVFAVSLDSEVLPVGLRARIRLVALDLHMDGVDAIRGSHTLSSSRMYVDQREREQHVPPAPPRESSI